MALTSQKANGPVPPDAVLHFKDRNVKHVETANLELVPKSLMSRKFNPENRGGFGKPGAYKRKSTRERVAEERDARWKKAMAIG